MKRYIRRKSEKELMLEDSMEVTVAYLSKGSNEWWNCDYCKIIFEQEDVVIKMGEEIRCPNFIHKYALGKKQRCLKFLTRAEPEYFKQKFIFAD